MGINLGDNLSPSDIERVKGIRNPSAIDAGDAGSDSDFGGLFDDGIFDDLNSDFGASGSSGASKTSGGSSEFDDIFGSSTPSSGGSGTLNTLSQGLNGGLVGYNPQQQQQQVAPKPDAMDKVLDYSGEAFVSIGNVIVDLVKSTKSRTADDIGYYSSNLIKTGLIGLAVGIILCIVAALTKIAFLGIHGVTQQFILCFALTAGFGMAGLGLAAISIAKADSDSSPSIRELPDTSSLVSEDATDDYEENLGDIMADLFGESDDDSDGLEFDFNELDTNETNTKDDTPSVPDFGSAPVVINYDDAINEVPENRLLNRKVLLDTFLYFLPLNTPDFSFKNKITPESNDFILLETRCLKALANILKCDLEEVKSSLAEAYETYFSYELKLNRVRGLNKTTELANELEIYFRNSADDTSVNATVTIESDYYKIIVTKGVTAVVTIGDTLKQQNVYDFFANEKNKLPVISGIGELGDVILSDAKDFDTMLIAGKPRSGKSWYVLGLLIAMMLFNPPENVTFIIVDPKESNLFKTLALMPHVAGLHNDDEIIEVLDDIINNESPRRKQILADNKCEDIWDLREKGINLPILYVVIDEYITVKSNLEEKGMADKLDSRLQVLISQLPSQGIRLLFVPHRATGVVNKTNRTMLQFMASVRGDIDDVNDTLGIKNWKHALVNKGDVAIKGSTLREAKYVRGVALTPSDKENAKLIEAVAKAYYKMGVDLPDTSSMTKAVNRDERKIREILCSDNRVQYTVNDFDKDEEFI